MYNMIEMYNRIETFLTSLRNDRRGVTAVEYAIIAGVVALVIYGAFQYLGTQISTEINKVGASV